MVFLINPGSYSVGRNEATLEPPVGLLYIAEVLKSNGFACEVYDANLKPSSPQEAIKIASEKKPSVVGLRVYYHNLSWGRAFIDGIRKIDPHILIGIGGYVASYNPKKVIEKTGADFAVAGEGEMPMLALANNISKNKPFYEGVPGLTARQNNGEYTSGPANIRIKNLDDLSFPDYGLVGGLKAYSSRSKFSPCAPIFTTRGCAFRCSFCSKHVFGDLVTFRSAENVIREIVYLKDKYGIRQVDILDDNFTVSRGYTEKILDLINKERLNLAFDLKCGVRVESLDEALLEKMRKNGFFRIAFGVESADERVLKLCNKQLDLTKLKRMALFAKKIGFEVSSFFIIGLPGETRESVRKTVALAKEIGLDVANFCMATPFPGTALYDYVSENGRFLFDPDDNYDFGYYGGKVFYTLPGADEKEILSRFNYAYRRFYTIPKILKTSLKIKSFNEFMWFAGAARSVFKGQLNNFFSRVNPSKNQRVGKE